MPDGLEGFLLAVLILFAIVGLVAVAVLIYVIVRFRPSFGAIAAVVGALIYGGSPIDLLPEALVGPLGYLDDAGLLAAAAAFMIQQIRSRRGGGRPPAGGAGRGGRTPGGSTAAGQGPVRVRQLPDE